MSQAVATTAEDILNRAYLHPRHEQVILQEYPLVDEPGTRYEYNNATSEIVALLLERATGRRYAEFVGNEVRTTDQSTGGGGALGLVGAFFDLEHNTFVGNHAANWSGGIALGAGGVALRNNLFADNSAPVGQGLPAAPTEHVNWSLDERDDGNDQGFLVFASGGNLFFPATLSDGQPRPTPGAAVVDVDPRVGDLVRDDGFPYYLPLAPGSPAVDAGMPLDTVDLDIRGTTRTAPPDIGAYELQ